MIASESTQRPPLRVGDWLVAPDRLLISRGEQELSLEPRVMELLVYLAERPREVISAEQLLIDIWHGPFYGDGPVQRAVAILRRCLGDNAQTPRYLETIRKRGYRLIADVVLPENYAAFLGQAGTTWPGGSPFMGLRAFDAAHSSVFFGRSRSSAALLDAMRRQRAEAKRLVLMLGPSGCGKTSLLRAGVLPLICREDGFDGLQAASVAWVDLADSHQGDALSLLAGGLCTWSLGERSVFADRADVDALLRASPMQVHAGIDSAFARWPTRSEYGEPFLLLIIDHAEAALSASDCATLNAALIALCAHPRVMLVLLCRSDFYPTLLAQLPAVADLKAPEGHFDLLPPTPGELAEIIRRPAQAAGLSFDKDAETLLGLDDVLRDAAVAHPEALPMLQYTLQALYEARGDGHLLSFAAYRQLGGLGGALALRAEQVFQELPGDVQAAWVPVFEQLVVSHETNQALTARRLPWSSLRSRVERELVHRLVDARLFTSSLDADTAHFSVTHETLLRAWPRVQDWARDNQRQLQIQLRVQQATRRWLHAQRRADLLLSPGLPLAEAGELRKHAPRLLDSDDHALVHASELADRRRRRIRLLTFSGALLLAALSIVSALLAVRSHQDAERRRSQAESLVDYLLTDLADELRPVGRLALMDHIAQRALDYLSKLPDRDVDVNTRLQRVRALRTLGEVFVERGNNRDATLAFGQASSVLDDAISGVNIPSALLAERGTVSYWQGMLEFRQNALAAAEVHFQRYRAVATELTQREPANPDWQLELSYALNNLGSLAHQRRQTEQALQLFQQSAALKDKVLQAQPDNSALAVEQADSLSWIGSALERQGQLREAAGYYDRQLDVLRDIGKRAPSADGWRHRLALAERIAGNLQIALGQLASAADLYIDAEQVMMQLVGADPSNKTWQVDLCNTQMQRAYLQLLLAQPAEARSLLDAARARLEPLLKDADAPLQWQQLLTMIDLRSAQTEMAGGNVSAARSLLDPSLQRARADLDAAPEDQNTRVIVVRLLVISGDLKAAERDAAAALVDWRNASGLLSQLVAESFDRSVLGAWIAVNSRLGEESRLAPYRERLAKGGYRLPERSPL